MNAPITPLVLGTSVDAVSDVSINYPGATGTQIIGVNAAGVVFGYYYNVLGSTTTQNAFAYDPTTNGWRQYRAAQRRHEFNG